MRSYNKFYLLVAAGSICLVSNVGADTPGDSVNDDSPAKFAFDYRRSGAEQIYVANPDGTNMQRLTDTPGPHFSGYPRWSPDHTQIAFISDREGDEEIYVMDADGSSVRRLTHRPGDDWSPAWTPDGNRIAFISGPTNHGEIYMINVDGTGEELLGNFVGEASGDLDWSADGQRLLFTSGRDGDKEEVYLLDLESRDVRRMTHSPQESNSGNASWSPAGDYIVFTSDRTGLWDVYRMNMDGSDLRRLTHSPAGQIGSWAAAQSPDGAHIIFSSDRFGNSTDWRNNVEIFVLDVRKSSLRRITWNQWMDAHPDW